MKIESAVLANLVYSHLINLLHDGGLERRIPEIGSVEEATICVEIQRALAMGKKRIQIDIQYPKDVS